MALTLEQKQQVVAEVSEVAANAYSAVAPEYHVMVLQSLLSYANKPVKKASF